MVLDDPQTPMESALQLSAAQQEAVKQMDAAVTKACVRGLTKPHMPREQDLTQAASGNRLVFEDQAPDLVTGNRLVSMDNFRHQLMPSLACSSCMGIGVLAARQMTRFHMAWLVVLCFLVACVV